MRRVLVDTGPLVALVDPKDRLHARATQELDRLKGPLCVGLPVLTEAHFLLGAAHLRRRVTALLEAEVLRLDAPDRPDLVTLRALEWLAHYAEHAPDFTDGFLVAWAERESLAIWTFDREFSTVWRTLAGKQVRLAAK